MTTSQKMLLAGLAIAVVVVALIGAAFACTATTAQPDTIATINAASTRVQETLIAQGTLPPPPAVTVTGPTAAPPTSGPPATDAPFQPPTLTVAPPATLAPAPTNPPVRGNGPLITAARAAQPPVIDSNFGDWAGGLPQPVELATYRPENWTGAADLSARYALAWDANYLYLAAQVADEAHVQTQRGAMLFRGDSLELLLDGDLGGDFATAELNGDDFQLGLSPGAFTGDSPEAHLWFPAARAGAATVTLVVQRTDLGYALEAAIPWSTFGVAPAAGQRFGFVLSASDNDAAGTADQQTMVSSVSTRRLTDPTSWGTLELAP